LKVLPDARVAAGPSACSHRAWLGPGVRSHRREETAYPAGWLYDRLSDRYGGQIFKDVDAIEPGDDFVEAINRAVGSCDVLLALVGDQWLTITDADGRRRLDDPDDFVRVEIEAALTRNVRVIPILVARARMPRTDELPAGMAGLVRRQALELSPSRFDLDTSRLLKVLDTTLAEVRKGPDGPTRSRKRTWGRSRPLLVGWVVAGIAALIIGILLSQGPSSPPPSGPLERVGLVLTTDGRDDHAANDAAVHGGSRAKGKYGDRLDVKEVTPTRDGSNRKELLDGLISAGVKLIFAVNDYSFMADIATSAKEHPEVTYVLVAGSDPFCDERKNMVCALFKWQDGSFLVGAAAALKSRSHVVSFVGGKPDNIAVVASKEGYEAGVRYIDEQKGTTTRFMRPGYTMLAGGNAAKGKELALEQIRKGADVIYHRGGPGRQGCDRGLRRQRGVRHRQLLRRKPGGLSGRAEVDPHVDGVSGGRSRHVGHRHAHDRLAKGCRKEISRS
jgi:hypothetical protein